tara:strand:- start:81 stop:335 length:255 start_codon:yes stop_codon:yes gene_type:complete
MHQAFFIFEIPNLSFSVYEPVWLRLEIFVVSVTVSLIRMIFQNIHIVEEISSSLQVRLLWLLVLIILKSKVIVKIKRDGAEAPI